MLQVCTSGGVAESLEIGGTDNPVIMDKINNIPIIPGSSLKGKMRSLLELKHEEWLDKNGNVHWCEDEDCSLCTTFGRSAHKSVYSGPTRLIVRDAHPTEETIEKWKNKEDILHGTEVKAENWINRLTSQATPRSLERVPAGSEFKFESLFSIYTDKDIDNLKLFLEAMALLEDNYLGGSGTRGYGKVEFVDMTLKKKTKEDYEAGNDWREVEGFENLRPPQLLSLVKEKAIEL